MSTTNYSLAELMICAASEAWREDGEVIGVRHRRDPAPGRVSWPC